VGIPKLSKLGLLRFWGFITLCANLLLKWGLNQSYSRRWKLSNGMSHATCTQGNWGDFWLLVVGSQIVNLTIDPSFGHNLCFKCPNGSCNPILDIYVLITFQWYENLFEPLSFDPYNHSLNIWESTKTPTPNMGVHLGVWRFFPLTLFCTPGGMRMRLLSLVLARTLTSPLPWSWAQG
jgi:hypothetical protein